MENDIRDGGVLILQIAISRRLGTPGQGGFGGEKDIGTKAGWAVSEKWITIIGQAPLINFFPSFNLPVLCLVLKITHLLNRNVIRSASLAGKETF